MTVYYVLLFIAAVLFVGQFLFTKQFQRYNGDSLTSTLKLSFFAYLTIAVFFFVKAQVGADGLRFGFSWFTLLMTIGIAAVSISCVYLGVKVLGIGNMSVYSTFMMIGSMVLPSIVGIVFYQETKNLALKLVAIALMLGAVFFTSGGDDKKGDKKALFFYIGVFILNGLIGVLFTVHQNQPTWSAYFERVDGKAVANSDVFMSWYGISTAILSGALLLISRLKNQRATPQSDGENSKTEGVSTSRALLLSLLIAVGYGVFNGLGNYFISLSTTPNALGSSVTFPIVNGGTIVVSTLMGIVLYKEKSDWKTWVGCVLVLVSTVLFMFAQ